LLYYLHSLCIALVARDAAEIRRLLRHPYARSLPQRVREEIAAIRRASPGSMIAPINTLHFYHQTVQLVLEPAEPGEPSAQLELPLQPSPDAVQISDTIARAGRVVNG
jgi:hypothetical protein